MIERALTDPEFLILKPGAFLRRDRRAGAAVHLRAAPAAHPLTRGMRAHPAPLPGPRAGTDALPTFHRRDTTGPFRPVRLDKSAPSGLCCRPELEEACFNVAITATGVHAPENVITNQELVQAFNAYADTWNADNGRRHRPPARSRPRPIPRSSSSFSPAASTTAMSLINQVFLDPDRMYPRLDPRPDDAPSLMAEMGIKAARIALDRAGTDPADIDCILCAASNHERAYPAISVEKFQDLLGAGGFRLRHECRLFQRHFRDPDRCRHDPHRVDPQGPGDFTGKSPPATSNGATATVHFIFGDVATAVLLERDEGDLQTPYFKVKSTRAATQFSNNIRNNMGFFGPPMTRWTTAATCGSCKNGRKVFKEVLPLVSAQYRRASGGCRRASLRSQAALAASGETRR